MGAALSIVVLFTVSSTIVRVAGVFLTHTGIPAPVARLQALSALSGTGFTTSESEMLMATPERRRILMILMITGSIGLASIAATLIVSVSGVDDTLSGVTRQSAALLCALAYVRFVLMTQTAENIICGLALRWLAHQKQPTHSFTITERLVNDWLIAEHHVRDDLPADPTAWNQPGLTLLGQREVQAWFRVKPWDGRPLGANRVLVLLGLLAEHEAFAATWGQIPATPDN